MLPLADRAPLGRRDLVDFELNDVAAKSLVTRGKDVVLAFAGAHVPPTEDAFALELDPGLVVGHDGQGTAPLPAAG